MVETHEETVRRREALEAKKRELESEHLSQLEADEAERERRAAQLAQEMEVCFLSRIFFLLTALFNSVFFLIQFHQKFL